MWFSSGVDGHCHHLLNPAWRLIRIRIQLEFGFEHYYWMFRPDHMELHFVNLIISYLLDGKSASSLRQMRKK